jgi:primase-polymerase (primpol)-like protein
MVLPDYLKVISENIPEELKKLDQWVVWKPIQEKGRSKPGKLPLSWQVNKLTKEKKVLAASCADPETWMTFKDAMSLLNSSGKYKGLQIALSSEIPLDDTDRLIGMDFDKAVLPDGSIRPEILEEVHSFNTYFELSPTDGLRGFCYGHFPVNEGGVHTGNIEIYQGGKFLTVTGHKLVDGHSTIEYSQGAIIALRAKYFKPVDEIDDSNLPITEVKFTDEELFSKLSFYKWSDQFKDLYYHGTKQGDDWSVKDKDLCKAIVFFTQDPEQINRIFRKSALFRPEKWDRVHHSNGDTYGEGTIKYVLKTRTTVYNEPKIIPLPEKIDFNVLNIMIPAYEVNKDGIFHLVIDREGEVRKEKIATTPCVITAKGRNTDT